MASFKDNAGREWTLALNVSNVLEVRKRLGFDLTRMYKADEVTKLNDIELLLNVLYLVCKSQADVKGISDVEYGYALAGDSINEAVEALWVAVSDFTPSKNRPTLRLIWEAGQEIETMAAAQVATITPRQLAELAMTSET